MDQARAFTQHAEKIGLPAKVLIRDRDGKFGGKSFDRELKEASVSVAILPPRSPNLNAYSERFIQTLKYECLDRFVVFGLRHLDYLASEFLDYFNGQRPHSSLDGHRPPARRSPPEPIPFTPNTKVACQSRLGA